MFQRENKFSWLTIILGILAALGVTYIIVDIKLTFDDQQKARELGRQEGVQMIVTQAIQMAEACQDIPLVMGEAQIVVRNVDCPKEAATDTEIPQETDTLEE